MSEEGSVPSEAVSEAPVEEVASSLEAEAQPNETPAETAKRLFRVKVDNNEMDVDEDELKRGYQMSKSAQKKFQEASQMNKRAEDFITMLKNDPKSVLSHPDIGVDMKAFAENYLNELQQEEALTPEQRERRDMEQRLEAYEKEKADAEAKLQEQHFEEQAAKYADDYQKQFTEVLSTSGLPKTEYTVARLAYYMQQAIGNGYDAITPKDVIGLVKNDYMTDIKAMFSASNEDTLLSLLGDDITNKTVKAHLKRHQGSKKVKSEPKVLDNAKSNKQNGSKALSRDEWKEMINKRTGK